MIDKVFKRIKEAEPCDFLLLALTTILVIFGIVMISPNSNAAMSIVKISVVPLNIYAVLSSIRRNTCCHNSA